jgi:hypothetical protein
MAVGDKALYSIIAPPEASVADVQKMTVEIYLNEENPPQNVLAEPLGRDPQGNSTWAVTVTEGAETPQEASGDDEGDKPGSDTLFGQGGP